jgi:hypothetical protein
LARYPLLRETPLADPAQRTEWNVQESDAVLILIGHDGLAASQGTALAQRFAAGENKPVLVVGLDQAEVAACWLDDILSARTPDTPLKLGIGGPRESEASGIYARAFAFLQGVLRGR